MICAVVLAAGQSRRMGCQKLLLPWEAQTVIGRVVSEVLRSVVSDVFVVVGSDQSGVAEALAGCPVTLVTNPVPDCDMLGSVRCGLRALPEGCEGVLVVLGDQPMLQSDLIDDLVRAFQAFGRAIVVPSHEGRRGHPLLLSAQFLDEVLTQYDGIGLCGLLQAHPDDVLELGIATSEVLADVDVPEDYQRELAKLTGQVQPRCDSDSSP